MIWGTDAKTENCTFRVLRICSAFSVDTWPRLPYSDTWRFERIHWWAQGTSRTRVRTCSTAQDNNKRCRLLQSVCTIKRINSALHRSCPRYVLRTWVPIEHFRHFSLSFCFIPIVTENTLTVWLTLASFQVKNFTTDTLLVNPPKPPRRKIDHRSQWQNEQLSKWSYFFAGTLQQQYY